MVQDPVYQRTLNEIRDKICRRLELGKCSPRVGERYNKVLNAIMGENLLFLDLIFRHRQHDLESILCDLLALEASENIPKLRHQFLWDKCASTPAMVGYGMG